MGSFWGHVDEAIFFLALSIWWLFHIFPEYIKKQGRTSEMKLQLSYGLPCKPSIPIEIFIKTIFPFCGFMAEGISGDWWRFIDDDGNFMNLVNLQHMSIYFIFVIHGLTDLCLWCGWPMIKNANLLTCALAFLWYGIAFIFHANMHGKEPLEAIIHLVPLPVLFGASACVMLRIVYTEGVAVHLSLAYCVLNMGTWFFHAPFMLYVSNKFPGTEPSNWDRSDPRNVAFAVGMFGVHLCANIVFMYVLYICCYIFMTRTNRANRFSLPYEDESRHYQKLAMDDISESSLDDTSLHNCKA